MVCHKKVVQPPIFSLENRTRNNIFQHSTNPFSSDYSPEKVRPRHLEPESFNDEKTSGSEFTIPDPDENEILRAQLAKQEVIDKRFQKEREEVITKNYEENKELLRRNAALKKKNEIAASAWQPEIVLQVEHLKRQEQKLDKWQGLTRCARCSQG